MAAYYNENDPKAAAMLRQHIIDGLIAPGVVDERSIEDVRPDELFGYTQCHFFAGIGGWSVALRLAGWPDDCTVWSGSCPCQPFSAAGKGDGVADERHLWPAFEWLISQCRPARVFGEQVERAITYGWWDDVATDLEGSGYTCAAEVLPACSVGFPHRRDRLWFVAYPALGDDSGNTGKLPRTHEQQAPWGQEGRITEFSGTSALGNAQHNGRNGLPVAGSNAPHDAGATQRPFGSIEFTRAGKSCDVANTMQHSNERRMPSTWETGGYESSYPSEISWFYCPDGKYRPVKSGVRLLVDGFQHRSSILHAFGNAIVPQVAAEFIKAVEEVIKTYG